MSDKEVTITYETLFDILRREKNNEELQKLPGGFYEDTADYLKEKFNILEESKKLDSSFSVVDKEKTAEDLLSIRKVLKELYNRREKKIIKVALDTAMINAPIGNTDNMLDYEIELFNRSIKLFRQFRVKVLENLLEGKTPGHLNNCSKSEQAEAEEQDSSAGGEEQDSSAEAKEQDLQEGERNNEKPSGEETDSMPETEAEEVIKVVLLDDVPEFVGRELEVYGPFKKGEEKSLPKEIADILIEKNAAKLKE
jgi:DNA replication initiation complex subunit (GINS family)